MNPFDVAVIAIVVVSALFAFVRGLVKEALSILVWVGAAAIAYYAFPYVLPLGLGLTTEVWLAQTGTAIVTFLVALIVLAMLSSLISNGVRGTALGPIDRLLGLFYGLARGAVIACLLYVGITRLISEPDRPAWFTNAQSLPTLERGAAWLDTVIPPNVRATATEAVDAGKRTVTAPLGTGRPTSTGSSGATDTSTGAVTPVSPPASQPSTTAPASQPVTPPPAVNRSDSRPLSENERLMQPPPPVAPAAPDHPAYRPDDRKNMDRAFRSVQ